MAPEKLTVVGDLSPQDRQSLIGFLCALVRTPSPSTQEAAVGELIEAEMRRIGFDDVWTDRIGNVIGRIGTGEGPRLLCDGHMDTVGIGERSAWRRDPFGAEIEDGVLYGRGAADMKSGLAAMIHGGKFLVDTGISLRGTLYVVGVVQEEPCEGLAVRVLIEEEGLRPDWVIIGEPTDLQIARGHRGRVELQVRVHGRSAHGSAPERGENAIYHGAQVALELEKMMFSATEDGFLGRGSLAVTEISSVAGSRNVIPDLCALTVDRRLTLGESPEAVIEEIENALSRFRFPAEVSVTEHEAVSYTGYVCRQANVFPAWVTAEDDRLVQATIRAVEETLGFRPNIGKWVFSTDGTYTAGVAHIPTVGFGPAAEGYAHTVEEQVDLEQVCQASRVYAQLAIELLT
jgi:putative selenium metabolism hydrolase